MRSVERIVALALIVAFNATAESTGYEDALVEWGLRQSGRERDPSPEGKRVEDVVVVSEDIVAPTDPYPGLLNWVHVRTRPSVVKQEVLLPVGSTFRRELAEETERNLRALFVLAIARVVPVRGSTPDSVVLLIVTKDLWSIRLNSTFNLVGTLLQYLRVRPTEQNAFGLNKQLSLDAALALDSLALGESFTDPRVLGTFHQLSEHFDLILNRATGVPEGTTGSLSFGLPLYSLEREWSWAVSASWTVQPVRVFRGASIWTFPFTEADGSVTAVPYVYDARVLTAAAQVTRSFGSAFKTNVTLQAGTYSRRYAPPAAETLSSDASAWLVSNYLPLSESAVYLLGAVRLFEARYAVMRNVKSFALSEDVQLGHSILLELRWADPFFLSPTRFGEAAISARYRWRLGDDVFSAEAAGAIRFRPGANGSGLDGPWVNRHVAAEILNASPFIGPGRIVLRGLVDVRADDLNHTQLLLGGGNGLRGVAPEALTGTREVLFNLEYRSRPWAFHTLHLGFVAFWDAGSAFTSQPALIHTVGFGLRALFPQFDISPLRIDFGYVINAPNPGRVNQISSSFGQIEDYRPAFLDTPLN